MIIKASEAVVVDDQAVAAMVSASYNQAWKYHYRLLDASISQRRLMFNYPYFIEKMCEGICALGTFDDMVDGARTLLDWYKGGSWCPSDPQWREAVAEEKAQWLEAMSRERARLREAAELEKAGREETR